MTRSKISRRDVMIGSGALAAGASFSTRVLSAAPPASAVTPALIEAAKKEGKVVWYTSIDLKLSEQIGKAFEAKYPGVTCKVERTGAERLLQRIGQEYSAGVHAVDVVNSSDASHLVYWKDQDMLAPYVPEDVAKFYPAAAQGRGRHVRQLPHLPLRHRLQHQSGEEGRGAEELCRSARPEMEGQDRQGASRLQRHHHDRDLPAARAISAGAISRSSLSRTCCRCSRPPIRRRSSRSASARCRPTASNTSSCTRRKPASRSSRSMPPKARR